MVHSFVKPSIVDTVSRYVDPRRSGKEFVALCPFHTEKTPSFSVNEDKGVYHCFGCGECGDVITFIQKIEGLSFKEALYHLDLTNQPRPTPAEVKKKRAVKETARNLADWALTMSDGISVRMREAGKRGQMARDVLREVEIANKEFLQGEIGRVGREWTILETLEQDLMNPAYVMELWYDREAIANIANVAGTNTAEKLRGNPTLTREYRERLQAFVRGEA